MLTPLKPSPSTLQNKALLKINKLTKTIIFAIKFFKYITNNIFFANITQKLK